MIEQATLPEGLLQRLRRSPLFSPLVDSEFQMLLAGSELIELDLGQVIHEPGRLCETLFILLTGKIRLTEREAAQESTLYTMSRPGDFFGGEVGDGVRAEGIGARAAGRSTVLRVRADVVRALFQKCPVFAERLKQASMCSAHYLKLKSVPRFAKLNFWQVRSLILRCRMVSIPPGLIASRKDAGLDGICIVLDGKVEASDNGEVHQFTTGGVFGALSSQQEICDRGNVRSLAATELLVLSRDAWLDLERYSPELASELEACLSEAGPSDIREATLPIARPLPAAPEGKPLQEPWSLAFKRKLRRYPFIRQQTQMDCGATCLNMICEFYGNRLSLNYLRELCGVGRYGTSALALAEAAEKLGFTARGLRATWGGLLSLQCPLICFWKQNHFVVLYEIHDRWALIGDPGEGLRRLDKEEFEKDFSGVALELTATVTFGKVGEKAAGLWMMAPILKPFLPALRDVLIASLAYQCLTLVTPLFTQVIVDKVIVHQSVSMLNIMLIGMVILTLFQTALTFLRSFLLTFVAMRADQALFGEFFRHLLSLPLKYFDNRTTGDVLARFGENKKISSFLAGSGISIILDTMMLGVYIVMIFCYNLTFAFSALAYLAVLVVLVVIYTPYIKNLSRKVFDKGVASESYLIESMRGLENIKTAAAEQRVRWRWEVMFVAGLNAKFHEMLAVNIAQMVSKTVHLAGQVLLLWLGANLVIEQKLTIGQLMALNMMVGMVSAPLMRLIEMWDQLQDVNISLERVGDIFEATPEEPEPAKKIPVAELSGHVKLDGVTFRYTDNTDHNTISNVSFEARPGQMVAIVGRSGSGKTTLMKLIEGLYFPLNGKIIIDGHDITQLSLTDYRKQLGVVSQQDYLFKGTIRENISFSKPDANLKEIIEAANISGIHSFISALPYGYETPLNEGGLNLSGGQRQRLAIARAIIHNPRILIFDEATSALDSESEKRIQSAMAKLRQGRTMFVVAHRLSTVRDADIILVLDRGQIVEQGTHDSLVAEKGLYYYLCSQQLAL